jgi:hypothetical protein
MSVSLDKKNYCFCSYTPFTEGEQKKDNDTNAQQRSMNVYYSEETVARYETGY